MKENIEIYRFKAFKLERFRDFLYFINLTDNQIRLILPINGYRSFDFHTDSPENAIKSKKLNYQQRFQ